MGRMPKGERLARQKLLRFLYEEKMVMYVDAELRGRVPDAWHVLAHDLDVSEPKEKVTLWLDRSVVKFYRAMGRGYQTRMNRILGTYAQMEIAGFLDAERIRTEQMKRMNETLSAAAPDAERDERVSG